MDSTSSKTITADEVRARAASAGIEIDPEFVEETAFLMENALASLRALDSRTIRLVEPAVAFDAVRGVSA